MVFELSDRWIWDFWVAEEGERYHLFFLNAPRSLGDPRLRHRHARIGHAVSDDLTDWTELDPVVGPGDAGAFDETATWTGSVIDDGHGWRLYYTGSRFLDATRHVNVQTIGEARSADLREWAKRPGPMLAADGRWYETLLDGTWHEEAWRDPWVYRADDGWHMLITARAVPGTIGDRRDAGVVGHAFSRDLTTWETRKPLSSPRSGFAHLEVLQTFVFEGRDYVLFSCDREHLAGDRASDARGGVWVAPRDPATGWCEIARARLVADEALYAGRIVTMTDGGIVLMGFENDGPQGFAGRIGDPIAVVADHDGWPVARAAARGAES